MGQGDPSKSLKIPKV